MKNIITYFSDFIKSLYCRKFYQDLISTKKTNAVAHILVIALLISIPVSFLVSETIKIIGSFSEVIAEKTFGDNRASVISDFPQIYYDKNSSSLKTIEDKSFQIYNDLGKAIISINTKEDFNNKNTQNFQLNNIAIIIDKNNIIFYFENTPIILPAQKIYESFGLYFNKEVNLERSDFGSNFLQFDLKKFLNDMIGITNISFIVIYIFSTIFFFLKYIFVSFIFAFIVSVFWQNMILFKVKNPPIEAQFKLYFKISAYTSSIVACLEILNYFSGATLFARPQLVYFTAHLIYIHFAIKSFREKLL